MSFGLIDASCCGVFAGGDDTREAVQGFGDGFLRGRVRGWALAGGVVGVGGGDAGAFGEVVEEVVEGSSSWPHVQKAGCDRRLDAGYRCGPEPSP
jgi:hypothetical protein